MSASTAIGMVGESLKAFLETEMQLTPAVVVTLLGPDESQANGRLNLFLYKVEESPYQKNMDWQVSSTDPQILVAPPLTLNLYYLVTPYAQNDGNSGNTNAHAMLGDAMRVLHETPVVPDSHLVPGLDDATEQLKITPVPLDIDDVTKIWTTFSQPYRLSVLYEVSVVQLDRSPASEKPLPTRVREIGVPDISAPFQVPEIIGLSPQSGPAGGTITVSGNNLDSWRAYAYIGGVSIAESLEISGNSFDLVLPASLTVGFHQITIDVSKLTRRTLFVEVTP